MNSKLLNYYFVTNYIMNSVQINEMRKEGNLYAAIMEQMDSVELNSSELFKFKADDKSIVIDSDTNGTGDTILKKIYLTDTTSKHYVDVLRLISNSIDSEFTDLLENTLPAYKNVVIIINVEDNRSINSIDVCVSPDEVEAIVTLSNFALGVDLADEIKGLAIGELVYVKYPILVNALADTSGYVPSEDGDGEDFEEIDIYSQVPEIEDEEEDIYEI